MLTVITGCMFSGKSERLISLAMAHVIAEQLVIGFKPSNDTRYDTENIVSHAGHKFPSTSICKDTPGKIIEVIDKFEEASSKNIDVVVIDEVQFFNAEILQVVDEILLSRYKSIIVSGLSQDSNGLPFGAMPWLLAAADDIIHLKAVCARSKQIGAATRTYRKNTTDTSQIVVGGAKIYEPRSFKEWLKTK